MEVFVFSCIQWRYSYLVVYNEGIRIQFYTMEVYVFSFIQGRYSYLVLYNGGILNPFEKIHQKEKVFLKQKLGNSL